MSVFCTYVDIQKEMQHYEFTTTSEPTLTEVGSFCSEVSSDMESSIRTVLTLPILDLHGIEWLRMTAVYGVCARIYRGMKDDLELVRMYQELYDTRMAYMLLNPGSISFPFDPSGTEKGHITHGFIRRDEQKYPRDENTW